MRMQRLIERECLDLLLFLLLPASVEAFQEDNIRVAGYGFRRLLYYVWGFGILLRMRLPPPPDERHGRPTELASTPLCHHSPAPDSRRCIEPPPDRLASPEAGSPVPVPVETAGPHDPCVDGAAPRGLRRWSQADSREGGSRGGKAHL